ncbi:microsomal dipeptidase-like Zn-dependent dipeptidase [Shimia isoporae]|uniref:Microsomal dipeptidase-like Zn-dependent dipeptidase n=1 Tax=Shimia isoporae TaxID=647720 RepID=A0A4R1NSV3_9RHOB|nr:membrane dipeptidase [Shimia isoporae]TCL09873.1 microsomal dipeptidase-like Zn-dependent dipeptidase [Shimia isoporae]
MRTFGKWLGRLLLMVVLAVAGFFVIAPGFVEKSRNVVAEHSPFDISPDAQTLHDSLVIGDWHADTLLWKRDPLKRADRGHVDVPRMQEGNVALQVFAAVTKSPAGQNYEENSADAQDNITLLAIGQLWPVATWDSLYERARYQAERLHKAANNSDGQLRVITSKADLDQLLADRAAGQRVSGGLLGIEGAHALEGNFDNLQGLEDVGYRVIGLHHFFDNELGGSLHGIGDQGLTDFGRAVVTAIQDRNLVLDLAHSSPQVARDVLGMTDMPLVVSHTGIYSNCPVVRNFQDDLMREIAATGGVVGIGYWADVTCDDSPEGVAKTIRAAIDLLGEDHVSLGSDFDGSVPTVFDTSELAAVTQALIAEDLTDAQIRKVMGENMVRVLRERLP